MQIAAKGQKEKPKSTVLLSCLSYQECTLLTALFFRHTYQPYKTLDHHAMFIFQ